MRRRRRQQHRQAKRDASSPTHGRGADLLTPSLRPLLRPRGSINPAAAAAVVYVNPLPPPPLQCCSAPRKLLLLCAPTARIYVNLTNRSFCYCEVFFSKNKWNTILTSQLIKQKTTLDSAIVSKRDCFY